ncbi:MAG: hypothetical protein KBG76_06490 [Saprospiraceae bacterium]|nr:hypothetical protein [Saprospiraceae bacterium]
MKNSNMSVSYFTSATSLLKRMRLLFLWSICIFLPQSPLSSQDKKNEDTLEKAASKIIFSATQSDGNTILLRAQVKARINGSNEAVDYETMTFSEFGENVSKPIGAVLTNDKGVAVLSVPLSNLSTQNGPWSFKAAFEGNKKIEEGEADVSLHKAEIMINGEEIDSLLTITIKLGVPDKGEVAPMANTEIVLYVQRYFSKLKIGEGITDENGEVVIECPRNLHGDGEGNIMLFGQAEDLEDYGTVSASVTKAWGVPSQSKVSKNARALWSHAPPLWMLVVFVILMTVVWGHYFVIIYKLLKLRKQ